MPASVRQRGFNPRLGLYFGVFTSLLVALVLVVLIFELLGSPRSILRTAMFVVPLVLYIVIGFATRTDEPIEYYAAGRRVPAFFNGTLLAVTAIGGTGFVSLTGAFFLHGFDAWCIATGIVAGFVLMGILVAPFVRKYGGFTLASFIGRRFDNQLLRLLAAVLLTVPMLLILSAELQIALAAAISLTGWSAGTLLAMLLATLLATSGLGGLRSMTWSATAQSIAAILAIVVPASLVAVVAGNLPLPQLSHGPTMRAISRLETLQGVPIPILSPLSFDLAGLELVSVAHRLAKPFGSIGPLAYVITSLVIMAGIAAAPWLVMRSVTTPGVYQSRKSHGWSTLAAGIVLLTLSAIAVFMRDYVMETVVGQDPSQLPRWFKSVVASGHAAIDGMSSRVPLQSILFQRDAVLVSLPVAAEFPAVVLDAALAGIIAAALAGSAAVGLALANTIAEDVIGAATWQTASPKRRLWSARISLAAVLGAATVMTLAAPPDPLRNFLWALALTAATAFPVVVLSIWWKRINTAGAAAAMIVGFTVTLSAILAGEADLIAYKGVLAGALGLPAGFAAALMVALLTPPPKKSTLELVTDLRIPGGETIYDRDARRQRLKDRQAG